MIKLAIIGAIIVAVGAGCIWFWHSNGFPDMW